MTDIDKFRNTVELMSSDEIATSIDGFMVEMNAHTMAADMLRKYVEVLYIEKSKRMRL